MMQEDDSLRFIAKVDENGDNVRNHRSCHTCRMEAQRMRRLHV